MSNSLGYVNVYPKYYLSETEYKNKYKNISIIFQNKEKITKHKFQNNDKIYLFMKNSFHWKI